MIGKGGFGTVYSGRRRVDGRLVAIKHVARAKITDWDMVRVNPIIPRYWKPYSVYLVYIYSVHPLYKPPVDLMLHVVS